MDGSPCSTWTPSPSSPKLQSWPEVPCSLPPNLWSSCLSFHLMSRSPRTILHSLRQPPACTSHATTLGCHGGTACSATSSTHSTQNRIYTSTLFFHQLRPHSPRLTLLVLSPGSTTDNREPERQGQHKLTREGQSPGSRQQHKTTNQTPNPVSTNTDPFLLFQRSICWNLSFFCPFESEVLPHSTYKLFISHHFPNSSTMRLLLHYSFPLPQFQSRLVLLHLLFVVALLTQIDCVGSLHRLSHQ